MLPAFLIPENIAREDGQGSEIALEAAAGRPLLLTLGITRILEQQSLDVSILGSPDGVAWEVLASFPQKFYCGSYAMLLDLSHRPGVRKLRANWKMGRWGRGDQKPQFGFYLVAQEAKVQVAASVA